MHNMYSYLKPERQESSTAGSSTSTSLDLDPPAVRGMAEVLLIRLGEAMALDAKERRAKAMAQQGIDA